MKIVVVKYAAIHYEAFNPAGTLSGCGTNPEEAIAELIKLDPRCQGLPSVEVAGDLPVGR